MNIYLRKILKHDITHQISVTKEILNNFFGVHKDRESCIMQGKKSKHTGNVVFLLATDPRFGGEIKQIIKAEGDITEDDILIFVKVKDKYIIELIPKSDERNKLFSCIMNEERHLIVNIDENDNSINKENLNYNTDYQSSLPPNRILFGAPGTGKSYTLNKDRIDLLGDDNEEDYERVTFHPDYSYSHFIGTYKPVPTVDNEGNETITYKYVPGPFMRMYVKALKNIRTGNPKPFLLIIEEINRANVAAVFGDVFQLLDRLDNGVSQYPIEASEDIKKYLASQLGGEPENYSKIRIPSNLFIWATMNSADQGVFPMDTAFKRRWDFTYLGVDDNDEDLRGKYVFLADDKSQKVEWNQLRKEINGFLAREKINEDKQLGPYFISRNIVVPDGDIIDRDKFIEVFKNKVIMYLFEDAAKQKREKLFQGCFDNSNRYSKICEEFDAKGIGIFNPSIQNNIKVENNFVPVKNSADDAKNKEV